MSGAGKRLKLGMVGGGQGAFIGGVHRIAARIDGKWDLVAGALSSDPTRAAASAEELGIASDRSYTSFEEMARAEAARADGIDAVAIVTPNHLHAAPAIAFLNAGIHVICDKPLTATQEQAEALATAARASSARFILTHNYTGYPLIRLAREMVARGDLGDVRVVQAEYAQDWLTEAAENKQADWRTDPARAGCRGDWRHRHPCVQPSVLCLWPAGRGALGRSAQLCAGAHRGRQRPYPAASLRRRARHGLGQPGRRGQ